MTDLISKKANLSYSYRQNIQLRVDVESWDSWDQVQTDLSILPKRAKGVSGARRMTNSSTSQGTIHAQTQRSATGVMSETTSEPNFLVLPPPKYTTLKGRRPLDDPVHMDDGRKWTLLS